MHRFELQLSRTTKRDRYDRQKRGWTSWTSRAKKDRSTRTSVKSNVRTCASCALYVGGYSTPICGGSEQAVRLSTTALASAQEKASNTVTSQVAGPPEHCKTERLKVRKIHTDIETVCRVASAVTIP